MNAETNVNPNEALAQLIADAMKRAARDLCNKAIDKAMEMEIHPLCLAHEMLHNGIAACVAWHVASKDKTLIENPETLNQDYEKLANTIMELIIAHCETVVLKHQGRLA